MLEKKPLKMPIISVLQTGGLASTQQLIDTTSNEIFSFKDSTSKMEITPIIYPYEERREETEEK